MTRPHLMVLAGAGASFDSDLERPRVSRFSNHGIVWDDPAANDRIPMANDLFGRQFKAARERYPQVQSLAASVMAALGKVSVEQFLGDYYNIMQGDARGVAQLMAARYYIRDVIREQEVKWYRHSAENNNWMPLLLSTRQIGMDVSRQLTFATTNYDCLIEFAISRDCGFSYTHTTHYISENRTNVIKLHGSVDWYHADTQFAHPDPEHAPNWIIDNAIHIDVPRVIMHHEQFQSHQPHVYRRIPAIAIPVKNKSTFNCPEDMVLQFSRRLAVATHLLVVGWRGEDPHIASLIKEHGTSLEKVVCVGPDPAELEKLRNKILPRHMTEKDVVFAPMGFSQFVRRSEQLDALLRDLQQTV